MCCAHSAGALADIQPIFPGSSDLPWRASGRLTPQLSNSKRTSVLEPLISKPVNDSQREFNTLCKLGGGIAGGPASSSVKKLLDASGKRLNAHGYEQVREHMKAFPQANPWHVCYALGLAWGHLAKAELGFTEAAIGALSDLNDEDLHTAASFHNERGPNPIHQSLRGGFTLFQQVQLPTELPNNLAALDTAQQRWLSPILSPARPPYIGSWNATAMFMCALFARPELAAKQVAAKPLLPPGGPIYAGLQLLFRARVLLTAPEGTELDDQAFEPGSLYINNQRLVDLLQGLDGWSVIDVHSGVYMLGTRDPRSSSW